MKDAGNNELHIGDMVWTMRMGRLTKAEIIKFKETEYPLVYVRYKDGHGKYVYGRAIIKCL